MSEESIHDLDAEALNLFARKGDEGGPHIHQGGQENGVKVRRIMQITRDLSRQPFPKLRILDLGCGEGVYAIEACLRGAEVIALDARTQRMDKGAACAMRHGLKNVRFIQEDVRRVKREVFGSFDVVYLLGMLYHLDAADLFPVLENIYSLCTGILIIDTLISLTEEIQISWRGHIYSGRLWREHADDDTDEIRRSRVLKSIDNTFSLRFTRESLLRAIRNIGFTSAYECNIPFEPGKAEDRITIVAVKGVPVLLSTYPWVNYKSDADIGEAIRQFSQSKAPLGNAGGDL
jgi:2-polyprenyl-3-methyl-5-hydroxy-6-metoxy-1,4-benzoquinol methylase